MKNAQAVTAAWPDEAAKEEHFPGEGAPAASAAVFNPEGARRQLGIGVSDFTRIFDCIWIEVSARRTLLDQAFQAGDLAMVALHAHTIKSSAATIGAEALSQSAQAVERAAVAGCLDELAETLVAFHAAKQTLSKLLGMG
jgi:histidine phosphotransfer protein HptB